MDDEVEPAPALRQRGEHRVHARFVGDVGGQDDGAADALGQRADALGQRLALIGEGELGAFGGHRAGDAPGDRTVVGDAHDEAALALHQRPIGVHVVLVAGAGRDGPKGRRHPTRTGRTGKNGPAVRYCGQAGYGGGGVPLQSPAVHVDAHPHRPGGRASAPAAQFRPLGRVVPALCRCPLLRRRRAVERLGARQPAAEVLDVLVPSSSADIIHHLDAFVANTGQLTAIGVVCLAVTAIMLMSTIENAFNAIWCAKAGRSITQRLVSYWTVLTLGPLLLGTALSIGPVLFAVAHSAGEGVGLGGSGRFLALVVLPLLTAAVLAVLYMALPHRPGHWSWAAAGGVVGALLFELLKRGFGLYIAGAGSYESVYGSLAALPIFLIWMYLA
ncbi:MAG: YihY family inner membrane protein [Alphaproteobacteria bacterium]|nr:YihY family inner membrane protein [Alphaproteobacteria bacterium]